MTKHQSRSSNGITFIKWTKCELQEQCPEVDTCEGWVRECLIETGSRYTVELRCPVLCPLDYDVSLPHKWSARYWRHCPHQEAGNFCGDECNQLGLLVLEEKTTGRELALCSRDIITDLNTLRITKEMIDTALLDASAFAHEKKINKDYKYEFVTWDDCSNFQSCKLLSCLTETYDCAFAVCRVRCLNNRNKGPLLKDICELEVDPSEIKNFVCLADYKSASKVIFFSKSNPVPINLKGRSLT